MSTVAYGLLWIFVFSVPWERILVLPGVAIVTRVTGGSALALALIAVVVSGRLRRWHAFHSLALLFWIWAGLGLLLFATSPRYPAKFWTFAQLLLVLWMVWELAPTERRVRGLLLAYVAGAYVAVFDTIMIYRREAGALRRFAAGGADPNDLAMVLALALPMAWYLGLTYRQPILRWVCRAYLPIAVIAIGLTGSRGGMAATTVALLIVPLSMTRLSPGRLATAIIVLGIAGAMAVVYIPETLIQRLSTIGTEIEGGRVGGRGKLWEAGLEVFINKPIFGYGPGLFKSAITPILGPASQVAHNSFISVLVEEGIVGLLLYLGMMGAILIAILKLHLLERRFALVLFATLVVAMLPLTWEDRRAVWVTFAVLIGFAQARLAEGAGLAAGARRPAPAPATVPTPILAPAARRYRRPRGDSSDMTEPLA